MSAEALGEKANKLHLDGYNCAQAVLLTLYEHMNPQEKNPVIPKIATGFGGGMGRCGSVCGALTGAFMAVGLKYGANEIDQQKKAEAYAKTQTLFKQFQQRAWQCNVQRPITAMTCQNLNNSLRQKRKMFSKPTVHA